MCPIFFIRGEKKRGKKRSEQLVDGWMAALLINGMWVVEWREEGISPAFETLWFFSFPYVFVQ